MQKRNAELDNLFVRMYEDNESGEITKEWFSKMSKWCDEERVKDLQKELDRKADKSVTMDMFIARVRKYTRAKKLTQQM